MPTAGAIAFEKERPIDNLPPATFSFGQDLKLNDTNKDVRSLQIFLNSIDRDGTGTGYDLNLVQRVSENVPVPVIACGGAGSVNDLVSVVSQGGAAAASAGSLFVFHGKHRAVLINFPSRSAIEQSFSNVA